MIFFSGRKYHNEGQQLLQTSAQQDGCKFAMDIEQDILFRTASKVCNKSGLQKLGRPPRKAAIVPRRC